MRRNLFVLMVLGLSACTDRATSPELSSRADDSPSLSEEEIRPAELHFAQLARAVPGTGGFYFDENGVVHVVMKDMSRFGPARSFVAMKLQESSRLRHSDGRLPEFAARAGQFDFFELQAVRNRITYPILELDGTIFVDLDEVENRVVVGISEQGHRAAVLSRISDLGVPRDAVAVKVTDIVEPIQPAALIPEEQASSSLITGRFRPVVGGTQIGRRVADPTKYSQCTMGFIARLDNGMRAFITNSHCSTRSWDTDGTVFYQAAPSSFHDFDRAGYEYRDRRGESCGFLSPNVCRHSDATAVVLDASVPDSLGFIARTRYAVAGSNGVGSLQVDPVHPRFRVTQEGGPAYVGQPSNKIGVTTGWTQGSVDRTCVDVSQPGRSWSKLRCQYSVLAGVDQGDSGSPVFYHNGDGTVILDGIVFGKSGGAFWYSPLFGIERDLGPLRVVAASGTTSPPPTSTEEPVIVDCTVDPSYPC